MAGVLFRLSVCAFYGVSSAGLSFINKVVFSVYNYPHPLFVKLT